MFLKKFEAGVRLTGSEVKYFRSNKFNMKGQYLKIIGSYVLWKVNLPMRKYFILLLNRKEILYLKKCISEKKVRPQINDFIFKRGLLKVNVKLEG